MYGIAGERRLTELELPWLPGYENSRPVRIGNAAHSQLQLDVYGELMDTMHVARKFQLENSDDALALPEDADGLSGDRLARAGRGHLGGARARGATSRTPR